MSEELKLLPCPFCGGEACYVDEKGLGLLEGETSQDVACVNTHCMPISSYFPAANWNKRPLESALLARAEKAEAEVSAVKGELALETLATAEYLSSAIDMRKRAEQAEGEVKKLREALTKISTLSRSYAASWGMAVDMGKIAQEALNE